MLSFDERDDRFTIKPSTIPGAGNGLFSKVLLAEEDRLEVIGVLIPADSVSDLCTSYADCYKFRIGDQLLIPIGYGGMVNHSSQPNLEKVCDGQRLYLKATRPIHPGEELLFTYSDRFFEITKNAPGSFSR
ncbi:MAG: hypothetical protein ABS79_03165 [Planctomycetes bacterium SCN 63-9]|nr:MAG: hypothetical protein ABS79_03165 [Planctomycetes bacterium SCN 63-9]